MYKPIIENFIFFKNFNNTDFIVRVLMCFKPILSLKNDILVKEGDYIEEILFVKKGNLSLQLPLPDLDQVVKQREKSFLRRSVFHKPLLRQKASLLGLENRVSYEDLTNDELNRAQLYDDEISCIHIQILEIRKNEHFGDILMFLNRKSPLSVKVKSKIVELFLLKKGHTMLFIPKGVCSRAINVEIEDGIIKDIKFTGGCAGNTEGVARLCKGMKAEEVIKRLKGIPCGMRPTSCPDQLARALEQYLRENR